MKNKTDITIIRDCSGSMRNIASDMDGGMRGFLQTQKDTGVDTSVTLWDFSTHYTKKIDAVDIRDLLIEDKPLVPMSKSLSEQISIPPLIPAGTTALNDTICVAIDSTGKRLADLPEDERPNRVCIIVITDGEENASREFTLKDVKEKIEHQKDKYAWDFVYLGANVDVMKESGSRGFAASSSAAYAATSEGVNHLWTKMNKSLIAYNCIDKTNPLTRSASFDIDPL